MQSLAAQSTRPSGFLGSTSRLRSQPFTNSNAARGKLQVRAAITKEKKEKIVTALKEKLEGSSVVFSVRFKKVDVATQQRIRKGLPQGTSSMVCKNTLMRVAARQMDMPDIADKGCQGENLWIFVPEDEIRDAVKFWYKTEEDLFKEAKANAAKGEEPTRPTEVGSAFMDRAYITPEQLKKCEDMPTKLELIAKVAGLVKAVPTKLARSINALPTKIGRGISAIADLDDDKSKLAGDVAQPKPAEDSA